MRTTTPSVVALALALAASPVAAVELSDVLPMQAPHCSLVAPPSNAGVAVTPGGFVMVHPRNGQLDARYTGCKVMWIVDTGPTYRRLATLYFEGGRLRRALAHDATSGAIRGACRYPQASSLMPGDDPAQPHRGCAGALDSDVYGLQLATWPRICAENADAPVCRQDPQ